MKTTVFVKNVKKHDGTTFKKYVTKLTKKDGSKLYTDVKFVQGVISDYTMKTGNMVTFPCVIEFDGNLSSKFYKTDDSNGTTFTNYALWINKIISTEPFIDDSLNDFEW